LIAYHLNAHRCSLAPELLAAFLRLCGAPKEATLPEEIAKAIVVPEYSVPAGRVDIRILLPSLLLFVELKIDATEGAAQLARYYAALKRQREHREGLLVYLTLPEQDPPDSRVPYLHISVDQLLKTWLPMCSGSSEASAYLARFLKSIALLMGYAGNGGFDDWSFGVQRAALDFVEEVNDS
jgi:hypothetical protein